MRLTNIPIPKTVFKEDELSAPLKVPFACRVCKERNEIDIQAFGKATNLESALEPYEIENSLASENGLADITSSKNDHIGKFSIMNLPASGKFFHCKSCSQIYIITYASGELSPGRFELIIRGLWQVSKKE